MSETLHIKVLPPAYQTEEAPFYLDLSCLVSEECQTEDLTAVKAIDVHAGQWPEAELQRLTTLDQSQLLALKVLRACIVPVLLHDGASGIYLSAAKALHCMLCLFVHDHLNPGSGLVWHDHRLRAL